MTEGRAWPRVAVVLAVMMGLQGCATVEAGRGRWALERGTVELGEGRRLRRSPVASGEEWEGQAEARRAEVEAVLGQVWAVAREVEEEGAGLDFSFWVEGGALTPLGWRRTAGGGERGIPVGEEAWAGGVRQLLVQVTEQRTGALALRLQRERRGWRTEYETLVVDAHLFPTLDINAKVNLVGVANPVHQSINRVWNAFRPAPGGAVTPTQVEQMVALVERHYGRWYGKVYDSSMSNTLETVERAALEDVMTYLSGLGR